MPYYIGTLEDAQSSTIEAVTLISRIRSALSAPICASNDELVSIASEKAHLAKLLDGVSPPEFPLWQRTIAMEREFSKKMKLLRYEAFAAEWRDGRSIPEIAKALSISLGLAQMTLIRARAELGEEAVPRRNKLKRLGDYKRQA